MSILRNFAKILPLKHNYIYNSCIRRLYTVNSVCSINWRFNYEPPISTIHKRWYRPDKHIDWVGIRQKWRVQQQLQKKKKHKNHQKVALRFRLTRFGWERLRSGRNAKKYNLVRKLPC
ncbi:conserved hypothetical protein [Theileria equi strain WA]|uniref:Uncharacterized protein n=1 Tax=Theileria equi strain WA TaxID=1537102 RepID=L1LCP4_THEEQ|nr:conserved hypothetical protein [Theileria equi strain WA]EKX73111.1 conserved hypothetical protein [Theileria equi strain WA]|eukprot:XP_004832563.1 conserved hypothetical protein [Theileria equi strain WA]